MDSKQIGALKGAFAFLIVVFVGTGIAGFCGLVTHWVKNFGPGMSDYEYRITDSCSLTKTSVHMVTIDCDDIEMSIGPKVETLGWDDEFLIATTHPVTKRMYPNNPNNTYREPDTEITYWWILDLQNNVGYGPIESEEEFNNKKEELGVEGIHLGTRTEAKERAIWTSGGEGYVD